MKNFEYEYFDTMEEVRKHIQADTLGYLSFDGMIAASGFKRENLSMGCFTGEYAVEPSLKA